MKHDGGVYDVAVSPDGKRALSAGFGDKTVVLWDLTTGKELHRFTEHTTADVLGVAISPDGKRGLSCDANQTAEIVAAGEMNHNTLIRRLWAIERLSRSA